MRKNLTRAEWSKLLLEAERRGDAASVAQQYGVNLKTMLWWRSKLRREARASGVARLLPVRLAAPAASGSSGVQLSVGPFTLTVERDTDLELVARLAARLRDAC